MDKIANQLNLAPELLDLLMEPYGYGRTLTLPYEDYLMLQLIGSTQSDVARKERVTKEILQNIMDCYKTEAVDWKTIKRIGLLGIDEIAQKKRYQEHYNKKRNIAAVI